MNAPLDADTYAKELRDRVKGIVSRHVFIEVPESLIHEMTMLVIDECIETLKRVKV